MKNYTTEEQFVTVPEKKIKKLIIKAEKLQIQADGACGNLVNEILLYYRVGNFHNEDLDEERRYVESLSIFKQAGDGLVIADEYGNNISVDAIVDLICKKKCFDYQDLIKNSI